LTQDSEDEELLMNDKPTYLTAAGKDKLEKELQHLRTVRRPEVAERIHDAKEDGDITENAAYEVAKNEQAFVEGRILTLETLLQRVEIIEEPGEEDTVCLGSKVTVVEKGSRPETFRIVGPPEADPGQGRISDESPLGHSLMGRQAGERVTVSTPDGPREFEILGIG
jgi:transcription elongation factor GreA